MKKLISQIFIFLLPLGIFAEPLKIVGSDIIGPVILGAAKESLTAAKIEYALELNGSRPAITQIQNNEADLAFIAIPKGFEKPDNIVLIPICFQAAVVIVNNENPLEEISFAQLYDIYSADSEHRAVTWGQVTPAGKSLREIFPSITLFTDNLVVELFKFSALKSTNIGNWVVIPRNKIDVHEMVKTGKAAISVVGKIEEKPNYKVLAVLPDFTGTKAGHAFKPTHEAIQSGDYPMVLNFYIAFNKSNVKRIKPFVEALLSDETADRIDGTDFYSVQKNFRKRSILELDILK